MEPILGRTASGPRQKYRCPLGHTRYFPTKKMRHFFYCNRMAVPRRNAYPVGIRANLYRSNSGSERAVAQLTILIITPGPQRTVCFNRNGMVTAACYMQSPCANLDGDVATDKCSMSQLSIGILTPRPQRTIVLHRNGVATTARQDRQCVVGGIISPTARREGNCQRKSKDKRT